jgi:RHS repeat-associated protein
LEFYDFNEEFSNANPINGSQVITNKGFSVKVVDYNDGIKDSSSFVVKLNGQLVQAEYNQTTKILTYNPVNNLPDGTYTVNIVATDKAGTKAEYTWSFTVKSIGPAITFSENGQTFNSTPTLTFQLQSNTDISQTGFSLKLDGIVIDPANYTVTFPGHWESTYDEWNDEDINYYVPDSFKEATVSYRPSSLFSGNHTIKLSAKDVSGNSTTIEGSFTNVGTQALEITAPANNALIKSTTAITATTNLSKMNVSVKKFGTSVVTNLGDRLSTYGIWNWDTTAISDGEYIITLTGFDALGNSVKTEKNVKVANIQQGMGLSHWGTAGNRWGEVNIANGNFVVGQSDIQLPGKGMGTEFSRVYNSQLKTNSVLGWGWRINVPELAEQSDKSVVITSGDGAKFTYTLNADGSYKMPAGQYALLTRNTDNNFELKNKDGSKYIFDSTNNKIILKDKNGNSVIYQYDSSQKLVSITDPSGRVTSLTYNTKGKLSSVKDYSSRTWTYAYDSNQNLIQVTNPLNKSLILSYDGNHQLTSITDGNGKKTTYSYLSGKLTGMTDPLNNTTSYSYDAAASKFVETDPKGNKTTSIYDNNWNVTTLTNADGGVVKTTYDENNNITSKTDALNRKTTYTFDSMGNVLSETDPLKNKITYVYDQNSNLLSKTNAMGTTTTYSYDSNGNLITNGKTSTTYNSDGTVSKIIDAKGNESVYTYDSFGNVTKFTDALGKNSTFTYNSFGLKLSETDAIGTKTTYSYDNLGRMLTVTVPDGNNPSKTTTYTYDANGNRLTVKDAAGNVSTWVYDGLNRVLSLTEPGNKVSSNAYDANGNRISEASQDGKATQYSYDVMNRLTSVNKADGSNITYSYDKENNKIRMVDSNGPTVNYEYNDINFLTKESSSAGKVTVYTYDKNNQLSGKTVNGVSKGLSQTYNYEGSNLVNLVSNEVTTNFTYDANSNRTGILYANKTSINYGYDELNRVTSVINKGTSGNTLSNFSYTYYDNGQIKSVTDSQGVTTYEYDSQNRLTKIIGATGKITSYTYDDLGNRSSESIAINGGTSKTSYSYDLTSGQLTSITKPDGSIVTYTYDVNGNTLSKSDSSGIISYEYNSNNQLSKVKKPNGDVIEYVYDGNNKRISKTVNGVVTKYVYDGDQILEETDASGNALASYVYDDKGSPISVTKEGKIYNYQYNGHGNVVALTDSNGNVVSTYDYDVWGNVISRTGNIDNLYGYAGQFGYVYDQETGNYFLQSRYYDPKIGRFTTKDRFKGFENRPASQNQYTYCENDSINRIDPNGYSSKLINYWWGVIAYVTQSQAAYLAYELTKLSIKTLAIGAIAALLTAWEWPVAAAIGITGIILGSHAALFATEINYYNNSRGLIITYYYWGKYVVQRQ